MEKELTKVITNEEGKNILVIDSREVAEMIGKTHAELLKEIEGRKDSKNVGIIPTLEKGKFHVSEYFIESSYKTDNNNKSYKCYLVTKMGCELIGNKQQGEKGILFTAKYVEKFNAMEKQLKELQTPKLPQTYLEALKALVRSEEEKEKVKKELEEQNSFVNKISESNGSMLVREVAKLASKGNITIGEKALWNKLREWGYISKKSTEPMQSAINSGWFEVIERVVERDGKTFVYKTTKVTGKGQIHIIKKLSKESENKLKKIQ